MASSRASTTGSRKRQARTIGANTQCRRGEHRGGHGGDGPPALVSGRARTAWSTRGPRPRVPCRPTSDPRRAPGSRRRSGTGADAGSPSPGVHDLERLRHAALGKAERLRGELHPRPDPCADTGRVLALGLVAQQRGASDRPDRSRRSRRSAPARRSPTPRARSTVRALRRAARCGRTGCGHRGTRRRGTPAPSPGGRAARGHRPARFSSGDCWITTVGRTSRTTRLMSRRRVRSATTRPSA